MIMNANEIGYDSSLFSSEDDDNEETVASSRTPYMSRRFLIKRFGG